MIKYFVTLYDKRYLSSWMVLAVDLCIVCFCFGMAYVIRFNFDLSVIVPAVSALQLGKTVAAYLIFFLLIRPYSGIIRHTGLKDVSRIMTATGLSLFLLIGINIILILSHKQAIYNVPNSIIIIHFLLSSFFLVGFRVIVKLFFIQVTRNYIKEKIPVIIYGAGSAGMLAKNALIKDVVQRYEVIAYIDDNHSKINKKAEGIPILASNKVLQPSFIAQHDIKQMIIAIQDLSIEKKKKIINEGLELNLQVKVVPPIQFWIDGLLSSTQFRTVHIEELLEREIIAINDKNITDDIRDKTVMITGGAGSIGSEIVRQILNYAPKFLIVVDQAESAIFDLQFELSSSPLFQKKYQQIEFIVANVNNRPRMDDIFKSHRPDIIYHAAAYKHVPLMEQNPYEAVMVNVFGTKIIADLSVKHGIDKFVMISTDKAVNPTNVMGASKRIAEMYIQSLKNTKTKFITTRFGNVLGSNGSVVPLFRKQIAMGGPITITHKDITRYFMTIPEACNLVLEAGAMGNGSEILIFDMGKPVRIYDLACKMIKLSGYAEDEILIEEIGLRPGEKLYEELMIDEEKVLPTHHALIFKFKSCPGLNGNISHGINELAELIKEVDEFSLVAKMKEMVPEFISNNSYYSVLDKSTRANLA